MVCLIWMLIIKRTQTYLSKLSVVVLESLYTYQYYMGTNFNSYKFAESSFSLHSTCMQYPARGVITRILHYPIFADFREQAPVSLGDIRCSFNNFFLLLSLLTPQLTLAYFEQCWTVMIIAKSHDRSTNINAFDESHIAA